MLAIRLQRTGRKGYPTYRLAVQEAQLSPSSGRVVAYVGNYNPHTKEVKVEKDIAQKYLDNGAQPSPRVVALLEQSGVTLPKWVARHKEHQKAIKNPEKLRKNQPKEETPEEVAEVQSAEAATE